MARLIGRLAPAAALGGIAVAVVAIADPAIASHVAGRSDASTPMAQALVADSPSADNRGSSKTSTKPSTSSPSTSTRSSSASKGDSCSTAKAVQGPSVDTRFGPVQVAATVANGRVCEVHAVAWPNGDHRSSQISAVAIPRLDSSASQKGLQFDMVSGATYTSGGYYSSLQQLLDSL